MYLAAAIADHIRLVLFVGGAGLALLLGFAGWAVVRARKTSRQRMPVRDVGGGSLAVWGVIFALVLVPIAFSWLRIVWERHGISQPDLVVTVIGRGDAWVYAYPNAGNFRFESDRLNISLAKATGRRVNYPMVVPAGKLIEIRATSADVSHIWSVPGLGVRVTAMPGRVTRTMFRAGAPGFYRSPRSEGVDAPVEVEVKEMPKYDGWLRWAKRAYTDDPATDAAKDKAKKEKE